MFKNAGVNIETAYVIEVIGECIAIHVFNTEGELISDIPADTEAQRYLKIPQGICGRPGEIEYAGQ
jgi:hypothetical protein